MAPDEGCHDVPDPIAPIGITFLSLDPMRTPMSFPFMTISGPIFIEPIPGIPSVPFIPPIWPGEGLAIGIGIFIFCSGEPCGLGEEFGIMAGIFIWVWGDAEGDACGICMPGMFICICRGEGCGAADCFGDEGCIGIFIPGMLSIWFLFAEFFCAGVFFLRGAALRLCVPGIFIAGMFIPGILLTSCFFAVCLLRTGFRFFRIVTFDLDFAFGLLIPGMLDMSWL